MAELLSQDQIEELKEAFTLFDRDNNGSVSAHELATVLRALGQNPTEAEIHEMLNEADIDMNGNIEFPEFVSMMAKKIKDIDVEEELIEAFRVLDKEGNGMVALKDLRNALTKNGDKMTLQEINEIMGDAQVDEDGQFNYEDFVRAMINS